MDGAIHCISLFYGILLLFSACKAQDEHSMVDDLIRQVGEMDKYFSTDLHRLFTGETYLSNIFPDMIFGDWTLSLHADFGNGYRGPVVLDERAMLQGIIKSLNESTLKTHAHHKRGRACNITIDGPQLIRNYIRYYRQLKEKMNSDTGMVTLGFKHHGENLTVGIMMAIDLEEEGMLKYLPYKIHDLRDVFGFTVPGITVPTLFTQYEVTVDGNCLPNYDQNTTVRLDLMRDFEEHIDQFFMVAIALQTTLFHMFSEKEGFRLSHRVCKVSELKSAHAGILTDRHYAVKQCCTLQKRHVLPHEFLSTKQWHCYDPYQLSNVLITISKALGLLMVALFPLAIKWLPAMYGKGKKLIKMNAVPCSQENSLLSSDDVKLEALPNKPQSDATVQPHDHNECYTSWIFLDDDSVYHFSFKVILWYLLLFNKVNRGMVMLRRFLFLYIISLLNYLAALQIHLYYTDMYHHNWQFHFTTFAYHIWNVKDSLSSIKKHEFDVMLTFSIFVFPFVMAVIQFLLLSPIFCRKESIAKILYWDEKDTAIGKYVGLNVQKKHQDARHQPYEIKLFFNLAARASYPTCYRFWEYIFTCSIFEMHEGSSTTCLKMIKLVIRVLLLPLMVPFYTFPIFSVFWVIFCGEGGFNFVRKRRCKVFLMRLVVGLGIFCSTSVLLACTTLYAHMIMFIMIDIIRTLQDTLTHAIFLISAIVNIKEAFNGIEDKYREMKLMVFQILEEMRDSPSEEDQAVGRKMLKQFDNSTLAIPKSLFMKVCKKLMPYGRLVTVAMLMLILKLSFLALLYMVIIDFQVFSQLSETGEGIITIVFVSLPSLLSKNKSDAEKGLEDKYMYLKVKSTIINASSVGAVDSSASPAKLEPDV